MYTRERKRGKGEKGGEKKVLGFSCTRWALTCWRSFSFGTILRKHLSISLYSSGEIEDESHGRNLIIMFTGILQKNCQTNDACSSKENFSMSKGKTCTAKVKPNNPRHLSLIQTDKDGTMTQRVPSFVNFKRQYLATKEKEKRTLYKKPRESKQALFQLRHIKAKSCIFYKVCCLKIAVQEENKLSTMQACTDWICNF